MKDTAEFYDWLTTGIEKGWISGPVCATHTGLPCTPEEESRYEEGFDDCALGIRLWVE